MDPKENGRFNKILINGYEELLREKPSSAEEHYIYYLLKHISPEVRKSDDVLNKFFEFYEEKLKTQRPDTDSVFADKGQFYNENTSYDFDYVILGSGLVALNTALTAIKSGARVALVDYVYPSSNGSVWDFGGSEINSAPTPSKLDEYKDYANNIFGSDGVKVEKASDYSQLVSNINASIRDFRIGAKLALAQNNVKYINAVASFLHSHSIELFDPKKSRYDKITGKNIIIAVGWRARLPKEVDGASDGAITSDDLFSLPSAPESILIVGDSFHSIELALFLASFNVKVTLTLKSEHVFGHVDHDLAHKIKRALKHANITVEHHSYPLKIEKNESGARKVTIKKLDDHSKIEISVACVVFAETHDYPVDSLNLEAAGVNFDTSTQRIPVNGGNETNIAHIFAVGTISSNSHKHLLADAMVAANLAIRLTGTLEAHHLVVSTFVLHGNPQYFGFGYTEQHAAKTQASVFTTKHYSLKSTEDVITGIFKVIYNKDSGKLMGIQACAHGDHLKVQCSDLVKSGEDIAKFEAEIQGLNSINAEQFVELDVAK